MAEVDITWSAVIALAPELASVSLEGQSQVLDQVKAEISVTGWGSLKNANAGALWLARHIATFYGKGGTGQLTSVTVGQVSKTFSAPTDVEGLKTTRYGQEYLRLVKKFKPRGALLRGPLSMLPPTTRRW